MRSEEKRLISWKMLISNTSHRNPATIYLILMAGREVLMYEIEGELLKGLERFYRKPNLDLFFNLHTLVSF